MLAAPRQPGKAGYPIVYPGRAAQLGGELYLEPRPGGGAQLTVRLPLPAESSDE